MQGFSLCQSVDLRQAFAGTSCTSSQAGSRPLCSLRTPVQMAQSLQVSVAVKQGNLPEVPTAALRSCDCKQLLGTWSVICSILSATDPLA